MSRRTRRQQPLSKAQTQTRDGFANLVQRVGMGAGNTLSAGGYGYGPMITRQRMTLEAAYRQSWIVGKAVRAIPEDMTREGFELITKADPEKVKQVQMAMVRMGLWDALLDGLTWGRLYGGCIGIYQIEGQDPSTPLDLETVGKDQFQGLSIFDRWSVQPDLMRLVPSGRDAGLPMYYAPIAGYQLPGQAGENDQVRYGEPVHHTRVCRFLGIKLPPWNAVTEMWWGLSVIEQTYDRLIAFETATMAVANLIDKAHLRRIGIEGLREILSAGGPAEEALIRMFELVRQFQSNEGLTLLDAKDQYNADSYTFTGLPELLIHFGQQIGGAIDTPMVRLFAESPSGLNSSGESDWRNYYDGIKRRQETDLRIPCELLVSTLWRSIHGEAAPEDLSIEFRPLWQMSDTEKEDVAAKRTATVMQAYDAGVVGQATVLRELRQVSESTGVWSNVTDEDIEQAEAEPVLPEIESAPMPGEQQAESVEKAPPLTAAQKIKRWLAGHG